MATGSEWVPIERGKVEVLGTTGTKLLDVRVHLNRAPEREWRQLFHNAILSTRHPPELEDTWARIRPPDNELEAYVEELDRRIALANEEYQQQVIPRLEHQAERERSEEEEKRRRTKNARRRAEEL